MKICEQSSLLVTPSWEIVVDPSYLQFAHAGHMVVVRSNGVAELGSCESFLTAVYAGEKVWVGYN